MFYVLPLLFFYFSTVCSVDYFSSEFLPVDITNQIIDFVGSEKNQIIMPDNSEKRMNVSLKGLLKFRAINKDFDQKILQFFDDLFHFKNRTSISNEAILNQVGNIVKIINFCNIPENFEFIKNLRQKISNLNPEVIKLFVPTKMSFLQSIDKNQIESYEIKSTEVGIYCFFYGYSQNLQERFLRENIGLFSQENKKTKYAFLPSWRSIQTLLALDSNQYDLLDGFNLNLFYKKNIGIPISIFDNETSDVRILIYENSNKGPHNNVNFISLYFLLEAGELLYPGEKDKFETGIYYRSCSQFKNFLNKFKTPFNNTKIIIDVNFINGRISKVGVSNKMKNFLRDACPNNFLIRSVFDEDRGDFYDDILAQRAIKKLKVHTNDRKEKCCKIDISEKENLLVQDVIAYIKSINSESDSIDKIEDLLKKLKKTPKQKKKKDKN